MKKGTASPKVKAVLSGVKNQLQAHERSGASQSRLSIDLAVISFGSGTHWVTLFDPCVSMPSGRATPKAFGSLRKLFSKRFLFPFLHLSHSKFTSERGLLCR